MKNLKFFLIIFPIFLVLILSIMLLKNESKENIVVEDDIKVKNSNLAIMIEKEIGSGDYEESDSNLWPKENYIFNAKISKCEHGSKLKYNEDDKTINVTTNKTDKCYVYFDFDALGSVCRGENMAECFAKNYKKDETLIYHNGTIDVNDDGKIDDAGDNSYRYSGDNPDNFVCFGPGSEDYYLGNANTCNVKNLYRIIGIFNNQIKLIQSEYADHTQLDTEKEGVVSVRSSSGKYARVEKIDNLDAFIWDESGNNEWANSPLQKILNSKYVTYLDSKSKDTNIIWSNMISNSDWHTNGISSQTITPKELIIEEMEVNIPVSNQHTFPAKIGLMYISDYGYSSEKENWINLLFGSGISYDDVSNLSNNWLYNSVNEWTISKANTQPKHVFFILDQGSIGGLGTNYVYNDNVGVRPVFYLNSSIKLQSGSGTKSNPYRLKIS